MRRRATLSGAPLGPVAVQWHRWPAIWVTLAVLGAYLWFLVPHLHFVAVVAALVVVHFTFFARTPAAPSAPTGLDSLAQRDPTFEAAGFLRRAEALFERTERAWDGRRLIELRTALSDGLFEQLSVQLELAGDPGSPSPIPLGAVAEPLHAAHDGVFDALAVSLKVDAFTEAWTFLRAGGSKGLEIGAADRRCPNCGGELVIADAAGCPHCGSWISSGQFGWVACAIVEHAFWRPPAVASIPGLRDLQAHDAGFSVEFVRDRAAIAFWRWRLAEARKDAGLMRGISFDSVCEELARAPSTGARAPSLLAVDVRSCYTVEDSDRVEVGVLWSADDLPGRRLDLFTLARRLGVKTDARAGLCSTRCPKCGAAPRSRDLARCEQCGQPFNDGSSHWTLARISQPVV